MSRWVRPLLPFKTQRGLLVPAQILKTNWWCRCQRVDPICFAFRVFHSTVLVAFWIACSTQLMVLVLLMQMNDSGGSVQSVLPFPITTERIMYNERCLRLSSSCQKHLKNISHGMDSINGSHF